MTSPADNPLVIWWLQDGKPGHENQSLGLLEALGRQCECERHEIPITWGLLPSLGHLLMGRFPPGEGLPTPDLIISAGHATHLPLLAARHACGGRAVVLMKPSLPVSLFDLCVIPRHDAYRGNGCYIETHGVLNPLHDQGRHQEGRSLILIGGPSRHYGWNDEILCSQLRQLAGMDLACRFILTTSRRTPETFLPKLQGLNLDNLEIVPVQETPPGWVAEQLAESATAWVTEDSVSMVYESLTAGTAVGILDVPQRAPNRVSDGLGELFADGWVVSLKNWLSSDQTLQPVRGFDEAERVACWILDKWPGAV